MNVQMTGLPSRVVRAWCTVPDCPKAWNNRDPMTNERFALLHASGTGHTVEVIEEIRKRYGPSSAAGTQEIEVTISNNGVPLTRKHGDSNGR